MAFLFLRSVPLLLLLTTVAPAGAQTPVEKTLLWRISGHGLERPSYLYGTMHVSRRLAYHLTDSFFVALEGSDVVATELDPENWLKDMLVSDMDALMRSDEYRGGGDMYHRLFDLEEPDHRTMQRVCEDHPDLVDHMLYRTLGEDEEREETTFLDLFIYQSGRKLGKDIAGLERFDEVLDIRITAQVEEEHHEEDAEEEDRRDRAKKVLEQIRKQGRSPRDLLEEAYRQNDLARMDTLYDLNSSLMFRHHFIDVRNSNMADAMEGILRERSLFAAVGAMHLPGPHGLIALLRDRGYRVDPVISEVTERSMERKKQLDELYRPPTTSVHWPSDSTFSIELPGKAYSVPDRLGSHDGTLCMDQVNGIFFSIHRIPTQALWRGWDPDRVMARVDSTLLEAVPGRTERKERITVQGMPGYDITSMTKRGERLRYLIVIRTDEVLVVRAGGRSDARIDGEVDRMLGTFRLHRLDGPEQGFARLAFPGASVNMPVSSGHSVAAPTVDWLAEGEAIDAMEAAGRDGEGHGYMLRSAVFQDLDHLEEDTFELGRLRDVLAERMGLVLIGYQDLRLDGKPAARARFKRFDGDTLMVQWLIRGPHYYMMASDASAEQALRFFDDLRLEPFPSADTTINDVVTMACEVGVDSWNHRLGKAYRSVRNAEFAGRDPKKAAYETIRRRELLVSPVAPEAVRLDLHIHHKYYSERDMEAYWKRRTKDARERVGAARSRKTMGTTAGLPSMDLVFTDSITSRALMVRYVNKAGATYALSTAYDTTEGLSAWQRSVYDSFTPSDTVFRLPVTENKVGMYLEARASTDKDAEEEAKRSLSTIIFREGDGPALRGFISGQAGLSEELGERSAMVLELGPVKDPGMLPFLRQAYMDAGDTAQLQLAVLRVLARQHSTEAARLFQELVFVETPFVKDASEVTGIFSPFFDSLATAKPLFPKVLDLTRFPEYRTPVYNLLAAMVEERLVRSDAYARQKDILLVEANVELKRALSMSHSSSSGMSSTGEGGTVPQLPRRGLNRIGQEEAVADGPANTLRDEIRASGPLVMSFARILLPLYPREAKVRAWFGKVLVSGNDRLVLETACLLARAGHRVDDAIWTRYSEQRNTREWLRQRSAIIGRPELFRPASDMLVYLAEGLAFANRTLEPEDSIRFVGERTVRCRFGEGRVFFFAFKDGDAEKDEWRLCYAGLYGPEGTEPADRTLFANWPYGEVTIRNITEELPDELEAIRFVGRPRARNASLY